MVEVGGRAVGHEGVERFKRGHPGRAFIVRGRGAGGVPRLAGVLFVRRAFVCVFVHRRPPCRQFDPRPAIANNQISILGLAEAIEEDFTSSDSSLTYVPFDEVYGQGIDDMLHRVPCTDKVREAIGWQPRRTLEDILGDVVSRRAP